MSTAHFPRGRYTPARPVRILDDHEMPFYHFATLPAWNDNEIQQKVISSAEVEPETWPAWTDLPFDRVLNAIEQTQADQDQPLSGVIRNAWENATIRSKNGRKGGAR